MNRKNALPSLFDIAQFTISSLILSKYWGENNHEYKVMTKK